MASQVHISVVIPIFNEEESLPVLHGEISAALGGMGVPWEVVYVDDFSTDSSLEVMLALREQDPHIRIIRFRRNFGQTAAMSAGFDHSEGEIVITMDGDLQNDPADIPRLVEELDRGYDIVAGWRKSRQDGFVLRRLPSRAANRLLNLVTGTRIHDTGCSLKAFRRKLIENLPIYAEQHRFLPAMSAQSGARISECVVNHRARQFGESKYGIGRAWRVLLDLFTIKMIAQFSHRPLHYFGLFSLPFAGLSIAFLALITIDFHSFDMSDSWAQTVVIVMLLGILLSVYFVLLGLLSELAVTASGMQRRRVLDRVMTERS